MQEVHRIMRMVAEEMGIDFDNPKPGEQAKVCADPRVQAALQSLNY